MLYFKRHYQETEKTAHKYLQILYLSEKGLIQNTYRTLVTVK